jgi:hypothetical protein
VLCVDIGGLQSKNHPKNYLTKNAQSNGKDIGEKSIMWLFLPAVFTDSHAQKSISMPKGHGFALTPYKGVLGVINTIT